MARSAVWPVKLGAAAIFFLALSLCLAAPQSEGEEAVTLTVGYVTGEGAGFPADVFMAAHPGIRVDAVPMERALASLYQTPLAGSALSLPDVFSIYIAQGSDDLEYLVDREILVSLDALAEDLPLTDYFPRVQEAVRYLGHAWALPHAVNCAVLCYDRQVLARAGVTLDTASWEGLFAAAEDVVKGATGPGAAIGFLESTSHLPVCEYMACTAGAPFFDLSDPALFRSPQLLKAYQLLLGAIDRGAVTAEQGLLTLRPGAAMGINNFTCLETNDHFGIVPLPTRIMEGDLPGPGPAVKAMLHSYAVRKNTPEKQAAAASLLRWLAAPETQMLLTERSDASVPHAEREVKSVYVPLRTSVAASEAFARFMASRPDYAHLLNICRSAYFPRLPAPLEEKAYGAAHASIERLRDGGLGSALAAAYDEVLAVTRTTAVESTAFDQF